MPSSIAPACWAPSSGSTIARRTTCPVPSSDISDRASTSSWIRSAPRRWQQSLKALRPGGRLVTCGATGGPEVEIDLRRLFWFQWSLLGSTMGTSREFAEIVAIGDAGQLRPAGRRCLSADRRSRCLSPPRRRRTVWKTRARGDSVNELVDRLRRPACSSCGRCSRRSSRPRSSCWSATSSPGRSRSGPIARSSASTSTRSPRPAACAKRSIAPAAASIRCTPSASCSSG